MTDAARILSDLTQALSEEPDSLPLPERMCRACASIVRADGAAITLLPASPERVVLAATDPVAARIEDLQEVVAQGPTHHAYTNNHTAEFVAPAPPEGPAALWDRFAESVHDLFGSLTVLAVPIRPGRRTSDQVLGVLMFYRRGARPMDAQADSIQLLADAIGAALIRDPAGLQPPEQPDDGTRPWSQRAPVSQATGMVMAQLGLTPADALVLLRAHAYAHDQSLDEVAHQVLDRQLDFTRIDATDRSPES